MRRAADNDVTETELAMLQVLWDQGTATRRQVVDTLYPGGGDSHYGTVQKLLERLEAKKFVRHERQGAILVFRACVDREEFIRQRLQGLADKLCGGVVAPLVMNLVRSEAISADEIEELYAVLRERRRPARKSSSDPKSK